MSYGKQYTSFRYYLQVVKRLQFVPGVSHTAIRHIMEVLFSAFSLGYKGKAVNFSSHSPCRRTPLARFLNQGKWDSNRLEDLIKASVMAGKSYMFEVKCTAVCWRMAVHVYF